MTVFNPVNLADDVSAASSAWTFGGPKMFQVGGRCGVLGTTVNGEIFGSTSMVVRPIGGAPDITGVHWTKFGSSGETVAAGEDIFAWKQDGTWYAILWPCPVE